MSHRAMWWVQQATLAMVGLLLFSCTSCTYLSGGHDESISGHQFFHGDR